MLNYSSIKHKGVILLRFTNQSPDNVIKLFIPVLRQLKENKVRNSLVIVGDDYIKNTPHPFPFKNYTVLPDSTLTIQIKNQ